MMEGIITVLLSLCENLVLLLYCYPYVRTLFFQQLISSKQQIKRDGEEMNRVSGNHKQTLGCLFHVPRSSWKFTKSMEKKNA